jgi:SHS2 domain-containing protein
MMANDPPKYQILPHTADGKFRAFGRTLEEAYANAALATASFMWDWSKVKAAVPRSIRLRGRDREQVLVKFLGEIIYLWETEGFLLGEVAVLEIGESGSEIELDAVFRGDYISPDYEIHGDVKAVTYNEMRIEKGDGFTIQVVVDI